tara:strand:+ start:176 stop:454 length:279 start_codon:yes stop_codon:yes gene_type:complete
MHPKRPASRHLGNPGCHPAAWTVCPGWRKPRNRCATGGDGGIGSVHERRSLVTDFADTPVGTRPAFQPGRVQNGLFRAIGFSLMQKRTKRKH